MKKRAVTGHQAQNGLVGKDGMLWGLVELHVQNRA